MNLPENLPDAPLSPSMEKSPHEARLTESMRLIRSLGASFAALVEMRKFAELVVDMIANDQRIAEPFRLVLLKGNLGKSLSFLDDRASELGVPRVIVAALRTLQAYGNYGAHYNPESAWPIKLSVDSAMASMTLIFDWIPRWLDRGVEDEEFGVNVADTIKLRAPRSRPGIIDRQWIWLLTRVSYPADNIILETGFGIGERSSICHYPMGSSAGIKRGKMLAFLAHQMDDICDMATIILRNECEGDVPKDEESLLKMIRQVSKERPHKVPDYICQDMMAVLRIKSIVSGNVDLDEKTLDALAMELNRRNFVDDVARWFAEKYIGMSQLEIHWRGWIFRTLLYFLIVFMIFGMGKDCGSSETSKAIQKKHCGDRSEETCSFCKKNKTAPTGSAR